MLVVFAPIMIGNIELHVIVSIGTTLYTQESTDSDMLRRHGDQAMYVAKELAQNRYHLFDTSQDDAINVQRESLEAIRDALDMQHFVLYYQPKVNIRIATIIGGEGLFRWHT